MLAVGELLPSLWSAALLSLSPPGTARAGLVPAATRMAATSASVVACFIFLVFILVEDDEE